MPADFPPSPRSTRGLGFTLHLLAGAQIEVTAKSKATGPRSASEACGGGVNS
jgi:hypothetical protein